MRQEEHCFEGVPKWVYLVEAKSKKAGESPENCVFMFGNDQATSHMSL